MINTVDLPIIKKKKSFGSPLVLDFSYIVKLVEA